MTPQFWEEAITFAVYLLNRVPAIVLYFKTPLDKLEAYVSPPSHLTLLPRVFGCVAFVHLHKHQRTKFDLCAYWLSPPSEGLSSRVEELKWMELFQDNSEVNWLAMRDLTASNEPTFTVSASTAPETEPTCTTAPTVDNVCAAPLFTTFLVLGPESPHADILEAFVNQMSTVPISSKVQEALSDSKWGSAMSEEIQTLEKNKT
ncbi:unnamed protein product [Prunus armeniaca]